MGVSKIVKSQIESNSQRMFNAVLRKHWCVKDRQITNWKQFTTLCHVGFTRQKVCQRSSNHKLKAIHNITTSGLNFNAGVSKIVKSQIESNSQLITGTNLFQYRCVKDRQITNWKQFTTMMNLECLLNPVCQRSSNHKLKAIHNFLPSLPRLRPGVSKIVKSQIESNSQPIETGLEKNQRCVKDRQITNWKQFTTSVRLKRRCLRVCQRSSNHKLKAIHNKTVLYRWVNHGVSKIVKSQIESNSQPRGIIWLALIGCVKDRQITNWKQFTTIRLRR